MKSVLNNYMLRFIQAIIDKLNGKPFFIRSEYWEKFQQDFLKGKNCRACGSTCSLKAHHIKPVHIYKHLELSKDNLIPLCKRCHFTLGHLANWYNYNPRVALDAKESLLIKKKIVK